MKFTTLQRSATRQRPVRSLPPMIETIHDVPAAADGTTRARDAGGPSRGEIALDRAADVGEQRVELGVGAGRVGELQALLELVDVEASVAGRAAERDDRALAVGIRGAQIGQRRRSSASSTTPQSSRPDELSWGG